MNKPMSAEEARNEARDMLATANKDGLTAKYAATLRAYADMLDRQTVDREAVKAIVTEAYNRGWNSGLGNERSNSKAHREDISEATDAILALMPVSVVKPGPDMSGLVEALEKIAALETEYPNATVRNMATIARKALATFKGGE